MIDIGVRARDTKEIMMFKNDPGYEFVFISTRNFKENHHYVPYVKHYLVDDSNISKFTDKVESICRNEKIDIIHSHNWPDTYGSVAYDIRKRLGIPFVHEIHDTGYGNVIPQHKKSESDAIPNADALICVSPAMVDFVASRYPGIKSKTTVIYSYPNISLLPNIPKQIPERFAKGVYQGGVNPKLRSGSTHNHRYYAEIFKSLVSNRGISLDVYPVSPKVSYNIPNVIFKPKLPVSELYEAISKYHFGFVGYYRTGSPILDMALPNKLFEYIACGIPVVSMKYRSMEAFINKTGTGVVVDDNLRLPPDFQKRMANAKRKCILSGRDYVMEKQKNKLQLLYKRCGGKK